MDWSGHVLPRPASGNGASVKLGTAMSNESIATITTMGIDIGKNSFHVIGLNRCGDPSLESGVSFTTGVTVVIMGNADVTACQRKGIAKGDDARRSRRLHYRDGACLSRLCRDYSGTGSATGLPLSKIFVTT